MDTLTLADILDAVTFEAGIDGQVSATGRYTTVRLTALFNRTWSSLRNLVSGAGNKSLLAETSALALPAPTGGETYITIPMPATGEVFAVDVQLGSEWESLEPISFDRRRTAVYAQEFTGYWSVNTLAIENGASAPTAGTLAVFPIGLTGLQYKVRSLRPWVNIDPANQTFVVVGYADWFTWAICTMAMTCTTRDNNKKGTYAQLEAKMLRAEARIIAASRRVQRSGPTVPQRRDGWSL